MQTGVGPVVEFKPEEAVTTTTKPVGKSVEELTGMLFTCAEFTSFN